MAIKPNDIPSARDRELLDQAEKEFDQYLTERFTGPDLYCNLPGCLPFAHRFLFLERYRKAGWRVYYKASSVDGAPEGPYLGAPTEKATLP